MPSKRGAQKIAQKRIDYLFELAQQWTAQQRISDAQNAIRIAKKLATSHVLSINHIKQATCKECNTLLIQGQTSTTRIHDNRRIITCTECNTIKRIPY